MKTRYFTLASIVSFVAGSAFAQTTTENYISTTSPKIAVETPAQVSSLSDQNKVQSVQYFDGLGRTSQTIAIKGSPNQNDLVNFFEYDQYGRRAKQYLPYAASSSGGEYQGSAATDQTNFYHNGIRLAHTDYPYGEVRYDNSPLNRVLESSAPGDIWAMNGNHTITSAMKWNGSQQVHIWTWDGANASSTAYFAPNEVSYSETTDEHGNLTRVFVDKRGRTLLSQRQHGTVSNPGTGTVVPAFHSTYMVYDALDRIVAVIPPLAYEKMRQAGNYSTTALSEDLLFTYGYDDRGRIVEKKIPGRGVEYIIYDRLDRPVLSQDANQRTQNEWWYFKYDALSRPVVQGIYTPGVAISRTQMQTNVDQAGTPLFEKPSGTDYPIYQGYTHQAYPTTNIEALLVNYYDNYDFNRDGTPDAAFDPSSLTPVHFPTKGGGTPNPISNQSTSRTRGLMTGTKVKIMDAFNPVMWLSTHNFYNEKMRLVQIDELNMYGGHDVSDLFYDFEGKIIHSRIRHDINNGTTVVLKNKFVYDHVGRVEKVYQQNNADAPVLLSEMTYNELGELIEKNVHSADNGTNFLQSVDYAYNIRGWLTHINNADLNSGQSVVGANNTNESVQSVELDQITINFKQIAVTRSTYKMVAEYEAKEIVNIFDHSNNTTRSVIVTHRRTIDLGYSDQTDPAIYVALKALNGESLIINYGPTQVTDGMNLGTVIADAMTALDGKYTSAGVSNVDAQEIIDDATSSFIYSKVGQNYHNDDTDDLFGLELRYDRPDAGTNATALYNGNISEMQWNTASENKKRHYFFGYDAKNQLQDAWYAEYSSSTEAWDQAIDNYSVNNITYDANGNIQSLHRKGHQGNGAFAIMDQLSYTYSGNQLLKVDDLIAAAAATNSFHDGTNTGNDYTYDANGNLTSDANKGFSVEYNRLNRATKIDYGGGKEINYLYAADGRKLKKTIKEPLHQDVHSWYVGKVVYDDGGIEFIFMEEGRLVPDQSSNGDFIYQMQHEDHLGNVRLMYQDVDGDGSISTAEIMQENHYYPFGLTYEGITAPQYENHRWKFNGVEMEEQFDLNLLMTEFRPLDAQLGRWTGIDPLSEQFFSSSPYTGFANNPISLIDPRGLAPSSPTDPPKKSDLGRNPVYSFMEYKRAKAFQRANGGTLGYHYDSNGWLRFSVARVVKDEEYTEKHSSGGEKPLIEGFHAAILETKTFEIGATEVWYAEAALYGSGSTLEESGGLMFVTKNGGFGTAMKVTGKMPLLETPGDQLPGTIMTSKLSLNFIKKSMPSPHYAKNPANQAPEWVQNGKEAAETVKQGMSDAKAAEAQVRNDAHLEIIDWWTEKTKKAESTEATSPARAGSDSAEFYLYDRVGGFDRKKISVEDSAKYAKRKALVLRVN